MDEKRGDGYRSLFWPIVFIGIGVVFLLINLDVFSRENIVVLVRLWPVLLILVGIDVMFGRRAPAIGALIGIVAVAGVIGLMLVGPELGWGDDGEVKTELFSAPIGEATSARVKLDLSSAPTEVAALSDSPDLISAQLTFRGKVDFDVSGDREKTVSLSHQGDFLDFDWFGWLDEDDPEQRWEIDLSPLVPLDLEVDGGSGSVNLDLSRLQLTALNLDVGSGSVDADLPSAGRYDARVDGGSGSARLTIAEGADLGLQIDVGSGSFTVTIRDAANVNLRADGGSGSLAVDVPAGAAVRVDVRDSGSGRVSVPADFERTRRGDDDEGTWETPGYDSADHQIEIVIQDVGSGSIEIQ